jgi:flagella basal body P-ring formation protein FlgA
MKKMCHEIQKNRKVSVSSFFLGILSIFFIGRVHADAPPDLTRFLTSKIEDTIHAAAAQPNTVEVGRIVVPNGRTCTDVKLTTPVNARLVGNVTVLATCEKPARWTMFVPVKIKVTGNYVVAARAIAPGNIIAQVDIQASSGDLAEVPASTINKEADAVGRIATQNIAAGTPLTYDKTRVAPAVTAGQPVKIVYQGVGFSVNAEGTAITTAAEGHSAQAKTSSGAVVSGTAAKNTTLIIK